MWVEGLLSLPGYAWNNSPFKLLIKDAKNLWHYFYILKHPILIRRCLYYFQLFAYIAEGLFQ